MNTKKKPSSFITKCEIGVPEVAKNGKINTNKIK